MSENRSDSMGLEQDEDIPETLSDEKNGMYQQMNIKDIREGSQNNRDNGMSSDQRKSKALKNEDVQRGRFLSPTNPTKPSDLGNEDGNQAKHIFHSPQDQLQHRRLQYKAFESANQNQENEDVLKDESEDMHKLIKELNEQAMDMLYSSNQKNVSQDGGVGGAQEYLVIQRKLSEIKQSAMIEPEGRGRNPQD